MTNTPDPPIATRRILHCDMDCFYAAVHMRDDPDLAGRPVVVGGRPEGRGVVAAASYEARRFGIRSATPMARAVHQCPDLVIVRPDFPRYREESSAIFEILRRFTPVVQPASLDEAYLDVTNHLEPWGSATAVAREIKRLVASERRLTVSVGVGPNRLVAKVASDFDKPDGLTVVKPGRVLDFLGPLPVRSLHGVGPATETALGELGVHTVADLRAVDRDVLRNRFGSQGDLFWRYARGVDERPVRTESVRKSLSSETTFSEDLREHQAIDDALVRLCESVASGLERRELSGRTVTVKVRFDDFTTVSRSTTVRDPVSARVDLVRLARALVARTEATSRPVRLLGVGVGNLQEGAPMQLPLFSE